MANNKNRKRVQAAKPRSPQAHALRLAGRGGTGDRIPSATAYKRPQQARWEA